MMAKWHSEVPGPRFVFCLLAHLTFTYDPSRDRPTSSVIGESMPIVQHQELRRFGYDVFKAAGIPDEDARIVSEHPVHSNLFGHDSHGVSHRPRYAQGMKRGYPNWEDREVVKDTP